MATQALVSTAADGLSTTTSNMNASSTTTGLLFLSPSLMMVGVTLAVIGNVIISAALNIQKYVHIERLKGRWDGTNMFCIPIWWAGSLLMLFGEVGNFSAYGFAPASVVAPLGAACVISNMFIAVIFLKERLKVEDIFACGIIVLGAFLIVTFSETDDVVLDNQEIVESLQQPAFLVYVSIELATLTILLLLHFKFNKKWAIMFLLICCILASFTVMSAKGLSGLLQLTLRGNSQVASPVPYILLLVMLSTAVIQVIFLNKALELYNATVIVPTNYVLFTISAILAAVIFYREMWNMDLVDIFVFLIGCALSFVGVYLLTYDAHYYDKQQQQQQMKAPSGSTSSETAKLLQESEETGQSSSTNEECKRLLTELLPCWFVDPHVRMVQPPSRVDYELATSNDTVIQTEKESEKKTSLNSQSPSSSNAPSTSAIVLGKRDINSPPKLSVNDNLNFSDV